MGAAFGTPATPVSDPLADQVREVWNLLGGTIDWRGVELWAEVLGVEDPELLMRGLVQIRNHFEDRRRAASSH